MGGIWWRSRRGLGGAGRDARDSQIEFGADPLILIDHEVQTRSIDLNSTARAEASTSSGSVKCDATSSPAWRMGFQSLLASGVDCGAIARFGHGKVALPGHFQPPLNSIVDIGDRFAARFAMRRAGLEIGNVRDPALVLGGPEKVDMIVGLVHGWIYRPCSSTSSRTN